MNLEECISKQMSVGSIKILPIDEKLIELGFYQLVHKAVRDDFKDSYQVTLFMGDKPYSHSIIPKNSFIDFIKENSFVIKEDSIHSMCCDDAVYSLAELSEKPSDKFNAKIENIQLLIDKYSRELERVESESMDNTIQAIFDSYMESDEHSLESIEKALKSILRV